MPRIHVIIPEDLDTAVRARLVDPLHGRIPKGELSTLIEMLLRRWLSEATRKPK
jgi:hypothetical protein